MAERQASICEKRSEHEINSWRLNRQEVGHKNLRDGTRKKIIDRMGGEEVSKGGGRGGSKRRGRRGGDALLPQLGLIPKNGSSKP